MLHIEYEVTVDTFVSLYESDWTFILECLVIKELINFSFNCIVPVGVTILLV